MEHDGARHPGAHSGEPAPARPGHPPRFGGGRPRRHLDPRRRRFPRAEGSPAADHAGRHDHHRSWQLRVLRAALRDPARRPHPVPGGTRNRPGAGRHGTPNHRAERGRDANPGAGHRPRSEAEFLEHAAARRVRHPRADHLQSRPEQPRRVGEGRCRHDGRDRRRGDGGLADRRPGRAQARDRGDRRADDQRRRRPGGRRHGRRSVR